MRWEMGLGAELKVSQLPGSGNRPGAVGCLELAQNVIEMLFDGADRDHQLSGNFFVRAAVSDQAQDFDLPRAQRLHQAR